MKEKPILFSAPMVRAILDGRKTQTRRIAKIKDIIGHPQFELLKIVTLENGRQGWLNSQSDHPNHITTLCPYGQPGESRLWVRETFFAWGRWETRFSEKKGRDEWHFIDMTMDCDKDYLYSADGVSDTQSFAKRRSSVTPMYWKRPAIFMPRWASRILLEVTGVRVERLKDISEADARAEGVSASGWSPSYSNPDNAGCDESISAADNFAELWESINGAGSWDANPFCWVINFKRVTP